MSDLEPMDLLELREAVAAELAQRRGDALYDLTGEVHCRASLGLPLGDRQAWAERIIAHRDERGGFDGGDGPGHALHMVLGALNLLGVPIPPDLGPLAPTDPTALREWLAHHDWQSTHKELCGQTIPLLASGRVGAAWIAAFTDEITARLDPVDPRRTWCEPDDPPWRVISCVYHVLSAFDAGRLPYPNPDLLIDRLLGLRWDRAADDEHRTVCTDGDWALLLLRLIEHRPAIARDAIAAIRRVSARRVRQWYERRDELFAVSNHHLFCYLWVTAVFQSAVREHYHGGLAIWDTLNEPALYRMHDCAQ
mgnify:CR=1